MQLAVEEQELQKAAAVKEGATAADEIQKHCTSLLEVFQSKLGHSFTFRFSRHCAVG